MTEFERLTADPLVIDFAKSPVKDTLTALTRNVSGAWAQQLLAYYRALQSAPKTSESYIVYAIINEQKWNQMYPVGTWQLQKRAAIDYPITLSYVVGDSNKFLQSLNPDVLVLRLSIPPGIPVIVCDSQQHEGFGIISFLTMWTFLIEVKSMDKNIINADYLSYALRDTENLLYVTLAPEARLPYRGELLIKQTNDYQAQFPDDLIIVQVSDQAAFLYYDTRLQNNYANTASGLIGAADQNKLVTVANMNNSRALVIPLFWSWMKMFKELGTVKQLTLLAGHWSELDKQLRLVTNVVTTADILHLITFIASGNEGYLLVTLNDDRRELYSLPQVRALTGSLINPNPGISVTDLLYVTEPTILNNGYFYSLLFQRGTGYSLVIDMDQEQLTANSLINYEYISNCPCPAWYLPLSYGSIRTGGEWLTLGDWLLTSDSTKERRLELAWYLLQLVNNQIANGYSQNQLNIQTVIVRPGQVSNGNWNTHLKMVVSNLGTDRLRKRKFVKFDHPMNVLGHPYVVHPYLQLMKFGEILLSIFDDPKLVEIVNSHIDLYNSFEDPEQSMFIKTFQAGIFSRVELPLHVLDNGSNYNSLDKFEADYQQVYGLIPIKDLLEQRDAGLLALLAKHAPLVSADWYKYVQSMSVASQEYVQVLRTDYTNQLDPVLLKASQIAINRQGNSRAGNSFIDMVTNI